MLPTLSGGAKAGGPALRGDRFMQNWQNGSVADALFVKISR